MSYSFVNYTAGGGNAVFAVTFPYIKREHVRIYLGDASDPLPSRAYSWITEQVVRLSLPPPAGTKVTIRRKTPISKNLVQFSTGYILAEDLNDSGTQLLYIVQEAIEADYIGAREQTVLDAVDRAIDAARAAETAAEHAETAATALIAPYHIGFSFSSEIGSGENIGAWVCPDLTVKFPTGIAESVGYASVPPASKAVFSIQLNEQEVGTVTFAPDENVAIVTATNKNFSANSGDRIRVISPSPKDPNIADVSMTLAGQRIPWEA